MRLVPWLVVLAACTPPSKPPPQSAAPTAPVASSTAPVVARPVAPVAAAPSAASAPTKLDVLFAGPCGRPNLGHVGEHPAFVFETNVTYFDGNEPRELLRVSPEYYNSSHSFLGEVGGGDAAHAWVVHYFPARGEGSDGHLLFAARKWKNTIYGKGTRSSDYSAEGVIEQPDGTVWSFARENFYSESATTDHFAAWTATGDLLDVKLPGRDMEGAERLASGELVAGAVGKKEQLVLRRWSPTRAVTDLSVPGIKPSRVTMQLGTARAVLAAELPGSKLAFYSYAGDSLQPVDLPAAAAKDTWVLTHDDDLWVAHGQDVTVHRHDGTTTRVTAPEPGVLGQDRVHVWWQATSGALHGHGAQGWTKVTLPDAPWAAPEHGPVMVEYVRTVGTETVVGTRHTEPGKKKKPVTVRTVYSSVPHGAPAHCGAPLRAGEVGRP